MLTNILFGYASRPVLDIALLGLRVAAGIALLAGHGWDKLIHFSEHLNHIPDPYGLGSVLSLLAAVFTNVFCAGLVIIGCLTRLAALAILATVTTGFFMVHGQDPWPIRELPFLYSLLFLTVCVLGSGQYAVDQLMKRSAS